MIELNELLRKLDVDPTTSIVMRHRPTERDLRKALRWLAAERPGVYNHYQSIQGPKVEPSVAKASHIVSCIGHEAGKALFIGVYRVEGWEEMLGREWRELENSKFLLGLGDRGPKPDSQKKIFRLNLMDAMAAWKGKLVLDWPPPERSWWRRAHKNVMTIHAIHEESVLVRAMPYWTELALTWTELQSLPKSWQAAIAQWRGVYLILDRGDGKAYVGSAYGRDNILARWQRYAETGHGGNVELKGRNPTRFRYSILERVSPDMPAEDVIALESNWKERLGTREVGLNKN